MGRVFLLFIAALFIGFLLFAFFFWAMHWEFITALNIGLSGALGGLVAEFIRLYAEKRKQKGNSLRR